MRCIGLWVRIFPSVHHVVTSTDVCNMVERKEKFKHCLSVLLVLDELDETKDRASERGKTREWNQRRQENGYFTNTVRELAASLSPDDKNEIRGLHRDIPRNRSGYYPSSSPKRRA